MSRAAIEATQHAMNANYGTNLPVGAMGTGGRAVACSAPTLGNAFRLWRQTFAFTWRKVLLATVLSIVVLISLGVGGFAVWYIWENYDHEYVWLIAGGITSMPMVAVALFGPSWINRISAGHALVLGELIVHGKLPDGVEGSLIDHAERCAEATFGTIEFMTDTTRAVHNLRWQMTSFAGGLASLLGKTSLRVAVRGYLDRMAGNLSWTVISYVGLDGLPPAQPESDNDEAVDASVKRAIAQFMSHKAALSGGMTRASMAEGFFMGVVWWALFAGGMVGFFLLGFDWMSAEIAATMTPAGDTETARAVVDGMSAVFAVFIALIPSIALASVLSLPLRHGLVRPLYWIREMIRFHSTIAPQPLDPQAIARVSQTEDYARAIDKWQRALR